MHSIEFSKDAVKALAKMPRDPRELIVEKIETIAADPHAAHRNAKPFHGRPEYRLRVHDWRVIYRVLDDRVVLLVIKIGVMAPQGRRLAALVPHGDLSQVAKPR